MAGPTMTVASETAWEKREPGSTVPETKVPETKVPETKVPETKVLG
jgi:hypothetical protein